MLTLNCATGTLAAYQPSPDMPWDKRRVMHLYRRMGLGATPSDIDAALSLPPATVVQNILNAALALPPTPPPEWADWDIDQYTDFGQQVQEQVIAYVMDWVKAMRANGFREKLSLFWQGHFVTKFEAYACPSQLYQYHRLLETHALGDFRQFVYDMGKTPAMLVFLNGVQNTRFNPNENYARELYELFTLGQDNGYTQEDIVQTARALTGFNGYTTFCSSVSFVPLLHDPGVKTIFGQTGTWGYDDVHDLLFEQRGALVARHICSQIYRFFVHPEVDEDILDGMAETLLDNDWALLPVFRQLFQSEHFFDEYVIGTQVKSPVDMVVGFLRESGFLMSDEVTQAATFYIYGIGQGLFDPPDVSGWPGNRTWIDSSTLTARWATMDAFLFATFQGTPSALSDFALSLSASTTDPMVVTQAIVDHFVPNGLGAPETYQRALQVFKWEVPQNYYDDGSWSLFWDTVPIQVVLLLRYISRLPEFQLH